MGGGTGVGSGPGWGAFHVSFAGRVLEWFTGRAEDSGAELLAMILGEEVVEVTTLSEIRELNASALSRVVIESG